jgi:hypothetical protein
MTALLALSPPLEALKSRATALWAAYPRETLGLGVLGLVVAGAIGGAAYSAPQMTTAEAAPPAPPPLLLEKVAPQLALQINSRIPLAGGPNPAALPFVFKGSGVARSRALECLASAVYYEAGSQGAEGERAVAQVVLNRVRHPAFPATVCGVVYQGSTRATGCQFTFTCDGSLNRQPDAEGWKRAYGIASAALSGAVFAPVGWATHYHADYVVPYWASTLAKSTVVGAHIFYRWAGGWGRPGSFGKSYSGLEPNSDALRNAALAAEVATGGERKSVAEAVAHIPGAEPMALTPSMRGDKRVAVRFNLAARKASEEAPHKDYVEKFEASDNLRWSLSSDAAGGAQQPLGKPAAKAETRASTTAASVAGGAQP